MRVPQYGWTEGILLRPTQALCSGRGGKIEIAYIRCINSRDPEIYELWAFSEDRHREVHPFARVQIRDNFTMDTFNPTFSMHGKYKFLSWVADL